MQWAIFRLYRSETRIPEDAGRWRAGLTRSGHGERAPQLFTAIGIEGGDDLRIPDVSEVTNRARGGLARIVPALEGGDEHGLGQLRDLLELQHAASFTVVADRLPTGPTRTLHLSLWGRAARVFDLRGAP